ncbi:MAG: ABC transporter ATP-binding protein [Clostridia bacterium]|nr:ABC transporter ATP-binding protein [Clostridia bacterium]
MPLLDCRDVTLGYERNEIIKNLSFSVEEGDYLCVLGENGSGKTTLMKTLLGLQPVLAGEMIRDGLKQNEIGYLPQHTEVQRDFPASVREIVLSGCLASMGLRPFYGLAEKRRADAAMARMGISSIAGRRYRTLSGGQQQRVLLARALCTGCKVLMLDEPVTGLDPEAAEELYSLVDTLNREDKLTVIMISHDLPSAMRYATHILHVGKEIFFGTRDAYLGKEAAE